MRSPPQPIPQPEPIIEPQDVDFPGIIQLDVDITDIRRKIFKVRQVIPAPYEGTTTLLFPKWLPGYHSPQAPVELLAGLKVMRGGEPLSWRRHPTDVHAFHVDVKAGTEPLEATYQFLSPTDASQGRVIVGTNLLNLEWNTVILYPAGHFARRIRYEPTLRLPPDWDFGCALEVASKDGQLVRFSPVTLDVLVDSPLFAGRHYREVNLDEEGAVRLHIVADQAELLEATEEQIEPHRELIRQADRLFGSRHFDRFDVLLGLSEEIGSIGVEHHRSCEAASIPGYFTQWDTAFARRDTIPHEYVHSWNGKYRRGEDSWSPCFHQPIRNNLMWVYEGQTQYWDRVLTARSGLWDKNHSLQALAEIAATHDMRAGSKWRPLSDTTRDPIIAARSPLPWPSWQRSEDYYTEGALVWLDVDTRIRELTHDTRSLDDFARAFFGGEDGVWMTNTYSFEDVVDALGNIANFGWKEFFDAKLNDTTDEAPLAGVERGGYRLVYRAQPSAYQVSKEAIFGTSNLLFSIGLSVTQSGEIKEVLWDSPAFAAALTAGSQILEVNGERYSPETLKRAIAASPGRPEIAVRVKRGAGIEELFVHCSTGHRFPHLEPVDRDRRRLDEILAPL